MRTAIFVYQTALITISTSEPDLELCGLDAATVPLSGGYQERSFAPGVYKIDSSHCVEVAGDASLFETVIRRKDNDPSLTSRASSYFALLDAAALQAFLSAPDAKQVASP